MPSIRKNPAILALLGLVLLGGCAAAIPFLVGMASKLIGTAAANYGVSYPSMKKDMTSLFTGLAKPTTPAAKAPTQPTGQPAPQPLALDVALLAQLRIDGKRRPPTPLRDGDVLYDHEWYDRPGGKKSESDLFRFTFRANRPCHVYIFGIDGSGWVDVAGGYTNPVDKNRLYELPGGTQWNGLDGYKGIEHLYVLATLEPRKDIEELLAKFANRERPAKPPKEAERVDTPVNENPGVRTRGWGPVDTKENVKAADGTSHAVTLEQFRAEGVDVFIARWFEHK